MKKVLIITYYWPPIGGAGVQRWLKFVKYLRLYGWEPIVYTPENPELFSVDPTLEKDIPARTTVLKTTIREPYSHYRNFTGKKKSEKVNPGFISSSGKAGLATKISVWIRGNFFIPDARKFWIKPSLRFLVDYLKENKVDAMVSTGPPHSMHLIALGIKKKLNIPWLADFRDPWTHIDFYDQLMLTSFADKKHRRLEQEVLQNTDKILTVGWKLAEELQHLSGKKVDVITNGYDEDDFNVPGLALSEKFTLCHTGSMNRDRNPEIFWKALSETMEEIPELKKSLHIKLIGKTDYQVTESLKKYGLSQFLEQKEYVPHTEAVQSLRSSHLLLLPLNNTPNVMGIVTGKLFEYLASGRPVILIGPEGSDSAKILKESKAGDVCGFTDKEKMKNVIKAHFQAYKTNTNPRKGNDISRFSRKVLCHELSKILNDLTG